ncbi:protein enabled homolog [Procambarus clarkii]|uniref:protein enabled homolog n=1 Tax=Procambarus clarkii TaxID=6728 RepID=UPI003743B260
MEMKLLELQEKKEERERQEKKEIEMKRLELEREREREEREREEREREERERQEMEKERLHELEVLRLGDSSDYDAVKKVVLKAYQLVPEAYRQKFRNLKKTSEHTFTEFANIKERLFQE